MTESRVVLITGASSGIGRATAAALLAAGHIVYGTSRNPERHASPWRMIALDVCDDASVHAAVDLVLAEHGRIDAVVNNAGLVLSGAIEDTGLDEARRQFETNVLGIVRMAKAVLPGMRTRRSGVIVNVGSLAGRVGMPFQGLYSASKFAVEGLTEALRQEVAEFGVTVALVAPGDTATGVVDHRVRVAAALLPTSAYRRDFERVVESFERDERAGSAPERVAAVIAAIVEGRSTAPRHVVGPLGQRILVGIRPFVPTRIFQWGMARYFRLGTEPPRAA